MYLPPRLESSEGKLPTPPPLAFLAEPGAGGLLRYSFSFRQFSSSLSVFGSCRGINSSHSHKINFKNKTIMHYTHQFNGPLSGTTRVSWYQKGKPILILLKQETVSGNGIIWAICKSAPHSRQITTPAPHHSVFYRPDALPAAQPTASKH